MDGGQGLVGLAAAGLIVANEVTTPHASLSAVFANGNVTWKSAEKQWGDLLFEAIGAIVLVVIAGVGQHGTAIAGVILALLWTLWLINHYSKSPKAAPAAKVA
ncbi:MAG: hypothetical protein M0Z46_12665 [Actinomycetota bacterium]|nr:hypothetical protein [Actinomycetota bacterium]